MVWLAPAIAATAGLVSAIAQRRSAKKDYERMNAYNAPSSQMARFQSAGLSPSLMYGQGTPGNQTSVPQPLDLSGVSSGAIQAGLAQSQIGVRDAQRERTKVLTELNKLQTAVLARNPYLDDDYLKAIVESMVSVASEKGSEARVAKTKADWFSNTYQEDRQSIDKDGNIVVDIVQSKKGRDKMNAELALLEQRFDLGTGDLKLKAEVLESKEFQNALLAIQKKWMEDGEITPQHIFQFIIMFLNKLK